MGKRAAKIVSVTSVRRALDEDIQGRSRRYLVSMVFRLICFVLVLVIPNWPIRIVLGICAVVIPAIAVLVANAGRERGPAPTIVENHGELTTYSETHHLNQGEFLR